jgi:DNA polymerase-3 subunit gamma/tau
VDAGALQLLARAADGSVRDALSLLDQAIAHADGTIDEATVRDMLGLVDRSLSFDILDALMRGDGAAALALLDDQYRAGADPLTILEDLLELTHWLTRLKLTPDIADAPEVPEAERVRGRSMAERLAMADVTRAWQILLKGLGETRIAPMPLHAAEMVLIRLAYAARLPTPAEALEALVGRGAADGLTGGVSAPPGKFRTEQAGGRAQDPLAHGRTSATPASTAIPSPAIPSPAIPSGGSADRPAGGKALPPTTAAGPAAIPAAVSAPAVYPASATVTPLAAMPKPQSFSEVVELARMHNEGLLYGHLITTVHLVRFEPESIEVRLTAQAMPDLPQRLSRFLTDVTGVRWLVGVSQQPGEATLREQQQARDAAQLEEVSRHPLVRAILDTFPGALIERVNTVQPQPAEEPGDLPED